jgi:hypothetical protein
VLDLLRKGSHLDVTYLYSQRVYYYNTNILEAKPHTRTYTRIHKYHRPRGIGIISVDDRTKGGLYERHGYLTSWTFEITTETGFVTKFDASMHGYPLQQDPRQNPNDLH